MITIVEPKEYVVKLWGKQEIKHEATYRLMRYVLKVEYENNLLLHNVVTGQLVFLERDEADEVKKLPKGYSSIMDTLVIDHFLVPVDFNESQEVIGLRTILRKLDYFKNKHITHYTILPTTGCNARCYYCYEQGIKVVKMSEQTANNVVEYINEHRDKSKKVFITWFGGEPTTATDRIDQICCSLSKLGVEYQSDIVTNAFLFDEQMVAKAKNLWHLTFAQIAVDGVGESYNSIKSFVSTHEDPFERVMRNIGLLLNNGISVQARMNFSPSNYHQFKDLVLEAKNRFNNHPLLSITAHAVITDFALDINHRDYESEKWFRNKVFELNEYARNLGMKKRRFYLPSLSFVGCEADNDTTVGINSDGSLLRCLENLEDKDMVGSITDGITNKALADSWKEVCIFKKCKECVLFPYCMKMKNCHGGDRCLSDMDRIYEFSDAAKNRYNKWLNNK